MNTFLRISNSLEIQSIVLILLDGLCEPLQKLMIALDEFIRVCHGKLYLRADSLNDGFALLSFTDQVKEESRCFPKIHVMQCRRNLASAGQGSSLKYPDGLAFAPILLIPYRCVFID